jgi:hypothetical protein
MPEVELDLGLQLIASIETLTEQMRKQWQHEQRKAQAIRQVPLATNQANAAGIIDDPAQLRCPTGYYMSVRRLSVFGFSAGTAIVYMNSIIGEPVATFTPTTGTVTHGKGHILMHPGDRLVAAATGITGFVQLAGAADLVEAAFLYAYLI